jgi:hypothetical protein
VEFQVQGHEMRRLTKISGEEYQSTFDNLKNKEEGNLRVGKKNKRENFVSKRTRD